MKRLLLFALFALLAGCVNPAEPSGDTYADPPLDLAGKGDLIALAQTAGFGDTLDGRLEGESLDLFRIQLDAGDELEVTAVRTSGTLKPAVSLYTRQGETVDAGPGSISQDRISRRWTVDESGDFLLAVRALSDTRGDYEVSFACVGGACAGDDPPNEVEKTATCLENARRCALTDLAGTGEDDVEGFLETCLILEGEECIDACEFNATSTDLCDGISESLEFHADQSSECAETLDTCMSECMYYGDDIESSGTLYKSTFGMCFMNGRTSTCQEFARKNGACGGSVSYEPAVCYEQCRAREGVFSDSVVRVCREQCGPCGIRCWRERGLIPDLPENGLVGDIRHLYKGEVDPFVVGDACILYVQVREDGDGSYDKGVYGLVTTLDDCPFRYDVSNPPEVGEAAHITSELVPSEGERRSWLEDLQPATYLEWDGQVEILDVGRI